MRPRLGLFAILAAFLALFAFAPVAVAQDDSDSDSESKPLSVGDFTLQGSATAGYRFAEFSGYVPQYREMFGLGRGPRLLDFTLYGQSNGKNPFADSFSLQLADLGGDPFPTAQFSISKQKLYDFRVSWRQSYYF